MKKNLLTDWMLKDHREYIIKNVKAPLLKKIVKYCLGYPEATRENVNKPNSLFLIELEEKFFINLNLPQREELFKSLWRSFKAEYEHDDIYAELFDWLLLELHQGILERRYKPHPPNKYAGYWKI